MAILDILKKKKEKTSKESLKKEKLEKVAKKSAVQKKEEKKEKIEKPKEKKVREKRGTGGNKYIFSYRIMKRPHITEKATKLSEKNEYVFEVYPYANKTEIKKSIESLYGVDVLDVRTVVVPRKRRRLGRTQGFKKGYKKAIVKIKEGQKIEILPR